MLPDFDLPPCPVFEGGFTPWESQEFVSLFQTPLKQENSANSNSGSDEPNRAVSAEDERKRRRMISNRESARRSRMRKQKHLEDLRDQLNRLRVENGEITTRLGIITRNCHLIRRDNDRLKSESVLLRQRLSDISRILLYRQLQQFSSPSLCPSTNRPLNLNYNNGLHLIP
uniref:BZIP domain-containing protein n=1 Tax=Nelumbo nucifera TaxID=4432 RepID=A0A822ZZH1_NELNU|nr:TPA_asm: hypothetical protein HUJ06_018163 [Nelumbo nucifera]